MSFKSLATRRTVLGAAAVLSMVAAGVAAAPIASAAAVAGTLSVASGPSAGGNGLTLTTATKVFAAGTVTQFQYASSVSTQCSAAPGTPSATVLAVSPLKVLTAQKLAFTVPSGVVLQGSPTPASSNYLVCVYNSSNALIANAKYTVAAAPTVSAISPASGPALGGGTVTITGTGFTAGTTAKIGSLALTGVTVVSATSLTGTVPAQAAGAAMAVSVTNTGGTASLASAYTYTNGIVVSPNTTPTATAATDIDVQGVGFSGLNFTTTTGTTPDDAHAHVYVTNGNYDPTDNSSAKTHPEIGECLNVLVISDTELICTVNTAHAYGVNADPAVANGTYTLTVVSNGGVDVQSGGGNADPNYSQSIVSSGSTFTVAPY